jgi:hypothetical protein
MSRKAEILLLAHASSERKVKKSVLASPCDSLRESRLCEYQWVLLNSLTSGHSIDEQTFHVTHERAFFCPNLRCSSTYIQHQVRIDQLGVKTTDLATLIAVTLLLVVIAFIANYIPARRAIKIDPLSALRCE